MEGKEREEYFKVLDNNIIACKEQIRFFTNYRKWYKPLNYFGVSKRFIKDKINDYKILLKINVNLKVNNYW